MFGRNPVLIASFVRAVVLLFMAFGVAVTEVQFAAVMLVVEAFLALWTNTATTPNVHVAATVNPSTGATAAGPAAAMASTDSQGKITLSDKPTMGMLLLLLIPALTLTACGKRYVPGTPVQSKVAYETKSALLKLEDLQIKVMAGVDSGAITPEQTKTAAKPFLSAVVKVARFTQDQLLPKLDAFDAAMTLGDKARADALTIEIRPLVTEFNTLVGAALGVQLPGALVNELSNVAEEVRKLLVTLRARFAVPQAQGVWRPASLAA